LRRIGAVVTTVSIGTQLTRDDIPAAIAYGAEMSRGRFVDLPGRADASSATVKNRKPRRVRIISGALDQRKSLRGDGFRGFPG
jgi:hypothetical protein